MSYHKVKNREEIIQDIFCSLMVDSVKHLKKNKLYHLKNKILLGDYVVQTLPDAVNPFDIKEDTEIYDTIHIKTFAEFEDFMRSSEKKKWLIDKGYLDVSV